METQRELTQKEINEKLTARGFKVKPVNRLAITVNELKKELEEFEALFKMPRLHLSNFFQQTRAEIDLAIQKQSTILTTSEIKEQLSQNYNKLIERLNQFEADCLKRQKTNDFEVALFSHFCHFHTIRQEICLFLRFSISRVFIRVLKST